VYQHPTTLPTILEADIESAIPLFTDPHFTPDTASLSAFLEYAIEKNWVVPMHRYKQLLDHIGGLHEEIQDMHDRMDVERNAFFKRAREVRDREDRVYEARRALEVLEEEMAERERVLAEREWEAAVHLAEKEESRRKREGKWWKAEFWKRMK